ncbi:MAG TPA: hypothetical protein VK866_19500, partial [Acidimicrobiales bacterium]|nr:hypothetical protein [Acidimicrobiales bacterium]
MRVLRLDLAPGEELDLHPDLSVIAGLDPAHRAAVLDRLADLARGRPSGGSGLLEAHGLLLPPRPELLAALGIPDETEVVVRAADLPGTTAGSGDGGAHAPR